MEGVNCLSCDDEIQITRPHKIGMLVTCAECGAEFEIVWLDPLELDWPFIDDDWEDEEEVTSLYDDD